VDITSITAAYNGLKFGKDLISALVEGKVELDTLSKVTEALTKLGQAQQVLFDLQTELLKYQSENENLRKVIGTFENWQNRFASYQLAETAGGAVVYESKNLPKHFACPSCVEKQQIQILQDGRTYSGIFRCPSCEAAFPVNARKNLSPNIQSNYDPFS
jgi:predicted RNA-binding Zn-ribbon protein involved in translation (DUF1610 family)